MQPKKKELGRCRNVSIVFFRLEASFPAHLLPSVVRAPAIAGHLVADWHGIPQGTTIAVAMGDLQCSVLATQPTPSDAGKKHALLIVEDKWSWNTAVVSAKNKAVVLHYNSPHNNG